MQLIIKRALEFLARHKSPCHQSCLCYLWLKFYWNRIRSCLWQTFSFKLKVIFWNIIKMNLSNTGRQSKRRINLSWKLTWKDSQSVLITSTETNPLKTFLKSSSPKRKTRKGQSSMIYQNTPFTNPNSMKKTIVIPS